MKTEDKEFKNLTREDKILQVLTENKQQTFWIRGNIIPGRVAECCYCGKLMLSEDSLPFFKRRPEYDTDQHYCGCRGWD